jgi:hypothetical protein
MLPLLGNIKLALIELVNDILANFEQSSCEFKSNIIYIVDHIKMIFTDIKEKLYGLELMSFLSIRNLGEQLISMHNRPGQLGKFLVQLAN